MVLIRVPNLAMPEKLRLAIIATHYDWVNACLQFFNKFEWLKIKQRKCFL